MYQFEIVPQQATYTVETSKEKKTELWSAAVSWTGAGKKYVDVVTKKGKLTIKNPKPTAIKCKIEHNLQVREIFKNEDWYFLRPQTRSPRTPSCPILWEKKLTSLFFLEIESMIAKTNFTLGPIEKSIFFVQL